MPALPKHVRQLLIEGPGLELSEPDGMSESTFRTLSRLFAVLRNAALIGRS